MGPPLRLLCEPSLVNYQPRQHGLGLALADLCLVPLTEACQGFDCSGSQADPCNNRHRTFPSWYHGW
jgi:hypothetical protein